MRLILEHHWITASVVGSIGFAFVWVGLRESLVTRFKIGVATLVLAILLFLIGLFVVTPTEHAKYIVRGFVDAVAAGKTSQVLSYVNKEVILVDDWKGESFSGHAGIRKCLDTLYSKYGISYNTILRTEIFERENDVLLELFLFSRVKGIGSVPSRWRILVHEQSNGQWLIYSIDAIEIAGRSYR